MNIQYPDKEYLTEQVKKKVEGLIFRGKYWIFCKNIDNLGTKSPAFEKMRVL